jgi:hypothetical protein
MVQDEARRLGSQHDGPLLHQSQHRRRTRGKRRGAPPPAAQRARRSSQRRASFASDQQQSSATLLSAFFRATCTSHPLSAPDFVLLASPSLRLPEVRREPARLAASGAKKCWTRRVPLLHNTSGRAAVTCAPPRLAQPRARPWRRKDRRGAAGICTPSERRTAARTAAVRGGPLNGGVTPM